MEPHVAAIAASHAQMRLDAPSSSVTGALGRVLTSEAAVLKRMGYPVALLKGRSLARLPAQCARVWPDAPPAIWIGGLDWAADEREGAAASLRLLLSSHSDGARATFMASRRRATLQLHTRNPDSDTAARWLATWFEWVLTVSERFRP